MAVEKSQQEGVTVAKKPAEYDLERWCPLSWSAIAFGGFLTLTVSAVLHLVGLGFCASLVEPTKGTADNLMRVGGVSGIWFLLSTASSLFIGGLVASTLWRLAGDARAALFHFGVWAVCSLFVLSFLLPAFVNGAGEALTAAGKRIDRVILMHSLSQRPTHYTETHYADMRTTAPSENSDNPVYQIDSMIIVKPTQVEIGPNEAAAMAFAALAGAGFSGFAAPVID